ncbi:MAG: hypothetical protein LIO58_01225 [Oscillospiraceae bacterium]|nr:hypothetical protein [Oscillospiraceae bacterium]
MANSDQIEWDEMYLSDEDYAAVQNYKAAWQSAYDSGDTAGQASAHSAAEAIRAKYNYSGGADGSEYNPFGSSTYSYGGSTYGSGSGSGGAYSYNTSAPSYSSSYQDQISSIADSLQNRTAFSYDYNDDPLYQQYKESYTREGSRASQDTLGQVAARTGGIASSYAASAATQANNYYMSQLADKVPELYQLAYSMYQQEGNDQRANLETLLALDQADYQKYQNQLSQYNADRSLDYSAYTDDRNFDYGVYSDRQSQDYTDARDTVQDNQWKLAQENTLTQQEYAKEQEKAQALASVGNFSGYATLWGLTEAETNAFVTAYAKAQQLTEQEAAWELAEKYAEYGDFSKISEQGVNTAYLTAVQNAQLGKL